MNLGELFSLFFSNLGHMLIDPGTWLLLASTVLMGIIFGALPGLTATLGVALLTTVTYGMDTAHAMVALLGIYVGAVYGGSYASILVNIPGTAAAAATAMDGYPLACKGEGGRALGLTTTASAIGTAIGMMFVIALSPVIAALALQFTSWEFFLLAFFGILISGTLTTPDVPLKGWIAGLIGMFMATIGRDLLQTYPRFTFGIPDLETGLDLVPVLIGAFGIPQIIQVLRDKFKPQEIKKFQRVLPEWKTISKHFPDILRSSLIGVGIGSVPGIGEDIAGWVSYGTAKNSSKHPETFGKGEVAAVISTETANNSCIGGALIPLLNLGIPGSPPAAMLLGALMLHNIAPGPMLMIDHPEFVPQVGAILLFASFMMWLLGINLAKWVVKILEVPPQLFMPIVGVLCVVGSYALGMRVFNLFLMVPVGLIAYFLTERGYPIAPLVIGVILGGMADSNLRRGLMVSQGFFAPMFTRPVALILVLASVLLVLSQTSLWKRMWSKLGKKKEKTAA